SGGEPHERHAVRHEHQRLDDLPDGAPQGPGGGLGRPGLVREAAHVRLDADLGGGGPEALNRARHRILPSTPVPARAPAPSPPPASSASPEDGPWRPPGRTAPPASGSRPGAPP